MRLIYLANIRLPTEKAHGLETMKLCEALATDSKVLVIPRRFNKIKRDPFVYYDIKKAFGIKKLPVLDAIVLRFLGRLGFWIEALTFSVTALFYILFKTKNNDIILSHDNMPLFFASFIRKKYFMTFMTFQ